MCNDILHIRCLRKIDLTKKNRYTKGFISGLFIKLLILINKNKTLVLFLFPFPMQTSIARNLNEKVGKDRTEYRSMWTRVKDRICFDNRHLAVTIRRHTRFRKGNFRIFRAKFPLVFSRKFSRRNSWNEMKRDISPSWNSFDFSSAFSSFWRRRKDSRDGWKVDDEFSLFFSTRPLPDRD